MGRVVRPRGFMKNTIVIALMVAFYSATLSAQNQETVLYTFGTNGGVNDGVGPNGIVADAIGNLFGTTMAGGTGVEMPCYGNSQGCGTIFALTPSPGGAWTETSLYNFCSILSCLDGAIPQGGLVLDKDGNLYGTAAFGGPNAQTLQCPVGNPALGYGCGVVFELSPPPIPGGSWAYQVLYNFSGGTSDGCFPSVGPLTWDAVGNLYGVTTSCGVANAGTVFKLSPPSLPGNTWTESVLYSFCQKPNCADGKTPSGILAFDTQGNLYGATEYVGKRTLGGMAYQLSPNRGGTWTETVLYAFTEESGDFPVAGVMFNGGSLYGTLAYGGSGLDNYGCVKIQRQVNCGGVFRLSRKPGGGVNETSFLFDGPNGGAPFAGLLFDGSTLYGSTAYGGNVGGLGTVFRIQGNTEEVLYKFCQLGDCVDGVGPGPIVISKGNLYGVAQGGASRQGVVFQIAP